MPRRTSILLLVACLVVIVMQVLQPRGVNPPVAPGASFEEAAAPPPEVARVVARACNDCHSHRTVWPWYSRVSPVSWFVVDDVNEGRAHVNLSAWNRYTPDAARLRLVAMCEEVRKGDMPPWSYRVMHSAARLSDADVSAVCGFAEGQVRPAAGEPR
jgi:cytochrome c553